MNWYKKIVISQKMRGHNIRNVLQTLRNFGVEPVRKGKGTHQIWEIPGTTFQASIPTGSNNIKAGTLAGILKKLKISPVEFMTGVKEKQKEEPMPAEKTPPDWQKEPWYQEQKKYELV